MFPEPGDGFTVTENNSFLPRRWRVRILHVILKTFIVVPLTTICSIKNHVWGYSRILGAIFIYVKVKLHFSHVNSGHLLAKFL